MDRDELRALQAPLKERYRDEPEAAVVTLSATGTLGEGVSLLGADRPRARRGGPAPGHRRRRHAAVLGRHAARGARRLRGRDAARGRDRARDPDPRGTVRAEGDLDFRGTLGVDKEAPVGFRAIRLSFDLDTDADDEQLATLLKLTERYCVVYQTLASAPELTHHAANEQRGPRALIGRVAVRMHVRPPEGRCARTRS